MSSEPSSFQLRDLSVSQRVTIAVFLLAVAVGYFSALVQLHFQHAKPGELMPGPDEAARAYGKPSSITLLEKLIVAEETLPFNASGSMRAAFTFRSAGWKNQVRRKAEQLAEQAPEKKDGDSKEENKSDEKKEEKKEEKKALDLAHAEKELRADRCLEADALVSWIRAGGKKEDYLKHVLSDDLSRKFKEPLTDCFQKNDKGMIEVNVESLIEKRCVRCHSEGKGGAAGDVHFERFEVVQDYLKAEHSGMSLRKLAQTSHVHLLGFCVLYGLTGFLFACTSYPCLFRTIIAPFPLIMQVIDISFWWLARLDEPYGPMFGKGIAVTGGLVAMGLFTQIGFTLLNLFSKKGLMVLGLIVLAGLAAFAGLYFTVIDPYLVREAAGQVIP